MTYVRMNRLVDTNTRRYTPAWQARYRPLAPLVALTKASLHFLGEIDALISAVPHCHFVTAPIFGPPAMAEKATLIIALSGEYRSKKEVAYILVPSIGRRVLDLGGNVEKGDSVRRANSYTRIYERNLPHKRRPSNSSAILWSLAPSN